MADDNEAKPPYSIGYGKPPKNTQFAPGQCGNPKGRPRGSKNFATVIQEELKSRITVTEDGKRKKISKRQAVVKQLVNKAAAGDPKAIPILLNETRLQENLPPVVDPRDAPTSQEDQMVLASIISRIRAAQALATQTAPVPYTTSVPATTNPSPSPQTEPEPKP